MSAEASDSFKSTMISKQSGRSVLSKRATRSEKGLERKYEKVLMALSPRKLEKV